MPNQVLHWGPVADTWMFAFESFFVALEGYARNRNRPVASMMVVIKKSKSLKLVSAITLATRLNHPRLDSNDILNASVFKTLGISLLKSTDKDFIANDIWKWLQLEFSEEWGANTIHVE
eukprot:CAMPEP_0196601996 /NCGR_PEP_ID=MMETSP1081-20130531/96199_1 /TAXON_ID=36882 /ORGANISM="Pyramimonas amylifera, Strain CCMP720" /LENGTH=118 /DNA_ID=CAMNT_0041927897 /DNA_START=975 /DNA_END=1331 /DNA_ORIENTATION=-